ncbi:MAG: hypothetical protein M3Z96_04185 [Pseudomonadota bacterium]|nr:hypothetical protein [Pseudomonadota bacterium]
MDITTNPANLQAPPRSHLAACKVSNLKRFEKNTLRAIFDLELPLGGIVLKSCTFHESGDSRWIGWPAQSYLKHDGTKSWTSIVDFVDSKAKYSLQDEVLPLVLAAMERADA